MAEQIAHDSNVICKEEIDWWLGKMKLLITLTYF